MRFSFAPQIPLVKKKWKDPQDTKSDEHILGTAPTVIRVSSLRICRAMQSHHVASQGRRTEEQIHGRDFSHDRRADHGWSANSAPRRHSAMVSVHSSSESTRNTLGITVGEVSMQHSIDLHSTGGRGEV